MKNVKKIEIDGDEIYLKKNPLGWKVVYPIFDEDGKFNLFNLFTGGSWLNLIIVGVVVAIILGLLFEYVSNMNTLLSCFDDLQALEVCKRSFMPQTQIVFP